MKLLINPQDENHNNLSKLMNLSYDHQLLKERLSDIGKLNQKITNIAQDITAEERNKIKKGFL